MFRFSAETPMNYSSNSSFGMFRPARKLWRRWACCTNKYRLLWTLQEGKERHTGPITAHHCVLARSVVLIVSLCRPSPHSNYAELIRIERY